MPVTTGRIELPVSAYEAFIELQRKILACEIDPEVARYEAIEILSPYWERTPEPYEATEVVLKPTTRSFLTLEN